MKASHLLVVAALLGAHATFAQTAPISSPSPGSATAPSPSNTPQPAMGNLHQMDDRDMSTKGLKHSARHQMKESGKMKAKSSGSTTKTKM